MEPKKSLEILPDWTRNRRSPIGGAPAPPQSEVGYWFKSSHHTKKPRSFTLRLLNAPPTGLEIDEAQKEAPQRLRRAKWVTGSSPVTI